MNASQHAICPLCFTDNDKSGLVTQLLRKMELDKGGGDGLLVARCIGCRQEFLLTVARDGTVLVMDLARDAEPVTEMVMKPRDVRPLASEEEAFQTYRAAAERFSTEKYSEAFDLWNDALAWFSNNGADTAVVASCLSNMGMMLTRQRHHHDALGYFVEALKSLGDSGDFAFRATILNNIGGAYLKIGDLENAETFHRRAFEMHVEHKSPDELIERERHNLTFVYEKWSHVSYHLGNYQAALKYEQQALLLLDGKGSPAEAQLLYLRIGNIQKAIADIDTGKGEQEEARISYIAALESHEKGNCPPEVLAADLKSLAEFYRDLGEIERAVDLYQRLDALLAGAGS